MEGLREFINSKGGTITGSVLLLIAVLWGGWYFYSASANDPANIANKRWFVDEKTGKPYRVDLEDIVDVPADAPSGGKTGYPAELCYWTADGKAKTEPTPVLLNQSVGKPGPTFCPDCKRLVVGHNPQPGPDVKPPPTEAEYQSGRR